VNAWKAIFAALVIFCAGVVTGGVAGKFLKRPPVPLRLPAGETVGPGWMQRMEFVKRTERQLDLTPAQRERVAQILKDGQEHMKQLWEPIAPHAREEAQRVRERILAELNPKQQKKFEQLTKPRSRAKEEAAHENPRKRERRDLQRHEGAANPPPTVLSTNR
jgi:DNA-binding MarR family transcriptional regulator